MIVDFSVVPNLKPSLFPPRPFLFLSTALGLASLFSSLSVRSVKESFFPRSTRERVDNLLRSWRILETEKMIGLEKGREIIFFKRAGHFLGFIDPKPKIKVFSFSFFFFFFPFSFSFFHVFGGSERRPVNEKQHNFARGTRSKNVFAQSGVEDGHRSIRTFH